MLVSQIKKEKNEKMIPVKASSEIKALLQKQADKYANGNLSEWLRFAGLNFVPSKEHLVPTPKKKK